VKLPASELVHELCERAHSQLSGIPALYDLVREHYRRGGVRFPVGAEGGGHSEGVHSDPTFDAVASSLERPPEPEQLDRRALLQVLDALQRLERARHALEARIPAQAAAIRMGHSATDGRTRWDVEAEQQRKRSVHGDIACLACQRPAGRLISGFDEACNRAWMRAGRPDRGEWIPQRRAWLDARDREGAEVVALRAGWDPSTNTSIGPADGVDRRAA
jgi:hypothetical protein